MHGCGGVGLSAVMIAAAAGARVVAVDIDREKLGRARRLGAEAAVDARSGGVEAVLEATGGGAHVSLDALGSAATVARRRSASLRKRGRHVQVGLMLGRRPRRARPDGARRSPTSSRSTASTAWPSATTRSCSARSPPASSTRRCSSAPTVGLDDAGAELEAMGAFARTGATVITSF